MTKKYNNKFTKDLQVGDLIFAYHKGVHQVIKIQRRYLNPNDLRYDVYKNNKIGDEYNALIHYK